MKTELKKKNEIEQNYAAAKRRKSVVVKNEMFKSSPSLPSSIKYHRSNFNSSNELLKIKTASSHLDDQDDDESIENNKENVNTDVIAIE